jgi:hypothetical protein
VAFQKIFLIIDAQASLVKAKPNGMRITRVKHFMQRKTGRKTALHVCKNFYRLITSLRDEHTQGEKQATHHMKKIVDQ